MTAADRVSGNQRMRGPDGRFVCSEERSGSSADQPADAGLRCAADRASEPNAALASGRGWSVDEARALAGEHWGIVRSWPLESGLEWLVEKMRG